MNTRYPNPGDLTRYPNPGDLFYHVLGKGVSVFQIISSDLEYTDHSRPHMSKLLIKTLKSDNNLDCQDLNLETICKYLSDDDCGSFSFIEFSFPSLFNKDFTYIGRDVTYSFNSDLLPKYSILAGLDSSSMLSYLPPIWRINNIRYVDNYFIRDEVGNNDIIINRKSLLSQYSYNIYYHALSNDSYIWGVRYPFELYDGLLSMKELCIKWSTDKIKLWHDLFEERYTRSKCVSDKMVINEECHRKLFPDEPKRVRKVNPFIFNVKSINGIRLQLHPTMKDLRSQFKKFVNQVIDHFDTNKEQKVVKAQLADVVEQLLNSVSKCKGNANNCEVAIATAVKAFNELNDSYDGTLIETEERESLYESLCSVGDYVECDVADIIEDNRDW